MLIDSALVMSDSQAITSLGSTISTYAIDFDVSQEIAIGNPIYYNVTVSQSFASSGAGTLAVSLETSSDNSTWTTSWTSETFSLSDLTAGAILANFVLPEGLSRYIRTKYTVGTSAMTAGKVLSCLPHGFQQDRYFPKGYDL